MVWERCLQNSYNTFAALREYAGALNVIFLCISFSEILYLLVYYLFPVSELKMHKSRDLLHFIATLEQCVAYGRHLINICSVAEFLREAFFLLSDLISVAYSYITQFTKNLSCSTVSSHEARMAKGQRDREGFVFEDFTDLLRWSDTFVVLMFFLNFKAPIWVPRK